MRRFGARKGLRAALTGAVLSCAGTPLAAEPIPPEFAQAVAASAAVQTAPEIPPSAYRSASVPGDADAVALAAALDRLILSDARVNPLGAGDWRAARAAIGAWYAARLFAPVWVDERGLTAAGRSAAATLARAGDDGLDLGAFAPPRIAAAQRSAADRAQAETTMAAAIAVYAAQASGSRIAPERISRFVSAAPDVVDAGEALSETAVAPDPGARLAAFNPPQRGYKLLRDAFAQGLAEVSARSSLVASDAGVTTALIAPADDGPAPRKSRRTRGATLLASADPIGAELTAQRRRALRANMEMWRWQKRDMGERRIEVNVPDFSVAVLDGDTVVHRARVVVGKPETPTPIFSDLMRYVVINPSWRVPDSIIKKEMLSKLDMLRQRGYEVKTVNGKVTVRQLPGERNALGRLAFMFPNDHAVYLHDTPAQALFNEDTRAFSHGCVRVEDPIRLAEVVMGWPEERIERAIGGKERAVNLPQPVPIHIQYFTEFVDEYGDLRERPDVYGLTRRVADTLSALGQD